MLVGLGLAAGWQYGFYGVLLGVLFGFSLMPLCLATARRKYQHSQTYTGTYRFPMKNYSTLLPENIEFLFDFSTGSATETYISPRATKKPYIKHDLKKAKFFFLPFGLIVYSSYFKGDNWHIPYPKSPEAREDMIFQLKQYGGKTSGKA